MRKNLNIEYLKSVVNRKIEIPKMRKKFLNRSERNKDVVTPAMAIFGNSQILTSRPEGMPYEDYKMIKNSQDKILKKLFAKATDTSINQYVNPDRKNFLKGHMNVRFKQRVTQRKTG